EDALGHGDHDGAADEVARTETIRAEVEDRDHRADPDDCRQNLGGRPDPPLADQQHFEREEELRLTGEIAPDNGGGAERSAAAIDDAETQQALTRSLSGPAQFEEDEVRIADEERQEESGSESGLNPERSQDRDQQYENTTER